MPRIVRNQLAYTIVPPNPTTLALNTNAAASAVDSEFSRVESTASSCRGVWAEVINVVAGKRYALRCEVKNVVGTISEMLALIPGTGAATKLAGWNAARSTDGVLGGIYDATTSGTMTIRYGIRPSSAGGTHPMGVTMGRVQFEEIPTSQSVISEYVFPGQSMMMPHAVGTTLVGGLPTDGVGASIFYHADDVILELGDSFSNDAGDWPQAAVTALAGKKVLYANGISGRTIATTITQFEQQVSLSPYNWRGLKEISIDSNAVRPGLVIISLGINDVLGGATLAQMQDRIREIIALCGSRRVIVFDLPPCKGFVSATEAMLLVRAQYNEWLPSIITGNMRLFKISDLLKDGTDPEVLAATYDSGDHLHPNATGGSAISAAVMADIYAGYGDWTPFDTTMPALSLASTAPGKLLEVQEWSKVASAKEIERY